MIFDIFSNNATPTLQFGVKKKYISFLHFKQENKCCIKTFVLANKVCFVDKLNTHAEFTMPC